MIDFQNENCRDCRYADKPKVGTGEPCCTYAGKLESNSKLCFSWRADEETNAKFQRARKAMSERSK